MKPTRSARIEAYADRYRARHCESPTVAQTARALRIRQAAVLNSERSKRFWICARNYCCEPIGLLFVEEIPYWLRGSDKRDA